MNISVDISGQRLNKLQNANSVVLVVKNSAFHQPSGAGYNIMAWLWVNEHSSVDRVLVLQLQPRRYMN